MTLFGWELRLRRRQVPPSLSAIDTARGWFPLIREPFGGAWQRNLDERPENLLTFSAVYACVTLIASDIAKLGLRLVARQGEIWVPTENPAYSPVLRKPNHYQTRVEFVENWLQAKLIHGNSYILKNRDRRGVVSALAVLDPTRVRPLVSPAGQVYYQVQRDDLVGQAQTDVIVPASEIIHDKMAPLYHPLVGISPITACGLAALQGLRVQSHSSSFFEHGARPGGLLTTPDVITEEEARVMQRSWEENYGGDNAGKTAVLGGDLKYQPLALMTATDAQLIEQLRWTAENVCMAFHVPPYMIGASPPPNYNNIEALSVQYYTQCLQRLLEGIEILLDEGLGLDADLGTEFDLDDLMRMDTTTRSKAAAEAVGSGTMSPNEARRRFWGLGPVSGGTSPYLQQQNYSLEALAKRDAAADPFGRPTAPPDDDEDEGLDEDETRALVAAYRRDLELVCTS